MNAPIDLRQFRYFIAVCEERHFGRAAARLHISQPPLSRQIRQLEDVLGVPLFVRSKSGVSLTPAGQALLPEARRTLLQADKAVVAARAMRNPAGGRLAVGYTTVFDQSAIPDVSEQFRNAYPDWQLHLTGRHSIHLVRELKNGSIDAAFIGLHTDAPGLQVEPLYEQPFVAALASGHRLARKRLLGVDDLCGEHMFWFERRLNPGYHDYSHAVFERIGLAPVFVPEPADHHILLAQVAEGRGIALIPASLQGTKRQGVVFRRLKSAFEPLSAGLAIAYSESNRLPVLRPFIALAKGWAATRMPLK